MSPIPNEQDATYLDQSELDAGDIAQWEAAAGGYWVISGGAVTQQGSPDGTVAVSAGSARLAGTTKTITAGNVSVITGSANPDGSTALAADSTQARFSLIVFDTSSHLGVVHGTPGDLSQANDGSYDCVYPSFTGKVLLAAVFIPPTFTTVATTMITDKRIVGSVNAYHDAAHSETGSNHSAGWGGKGYVIVGLTSTTGDALAPGTNGQMLTAQSGQTDGLQYATVWTAVPFSKPGALTTGTGTLVWRNDTGRTLTISKIVGRVTTAPTGQAILVDVNSDTAVTDTFATIWGVTHANQLNIQAGQKSGSQTTFDTTTLADGKSITVDIDQVGSTIAGSDLTVNIWFSG